jgi:solute carrier family 25 protein 34/35
MNPADNVRTRLYSQPYCATTGRGKLYTGMVDCFSRTVAVEGVGGLYKGLTGNMARQGPHFVLVYAFTDVLFRNFDIGSGA